MNVTHNNGKYSNKDLIEMEISSLPNFNRVSVKPNVQSKARFCYVMVRKCIKPNVQALAKVPVTKGYALN